MQCRPRLPYDVNFQVHEGKVTCCSTLRSFLATASQNEVKIWLLQEPPNRTPVLVHTLKHEKPVLYARLSTPELLVTADASKGYIWQGSTLIRTTPRAIHCRCGIRSLSGAVCWNEFKSI